MKSSPTTTTKEPRSYRWGFRSALPALFAIAVWTEVLVMLSGFTRGGLSGTPRLLAAIGMFLTLLPLFMLLLYRWPLVFGFFRSVKVGVTNLILIGLGSILGVLFYQENPDRPLPAGAVESLADWVDEGSNRPWTDDEIRAYDMYAGVAPDHATFRNAQAFFLYHFFESLGLDGLLGIDKELDLDPDRVNARVAGFHRDWEERLHARYGPELTVALRRQSYDGLTNQQHDARVGELEVKWDRGLWNLFVWSNRLDLIRAYKSDWFAAFWVVLFCGVLSNTFRGGWRRLLRPGKWGFVSTHAGIMLIVIGGGVSRFTEERGMVELNQGNPSREASGTWLRWSEMGTRTQSQGRVFGRSLRGGLKDPFVVQLEEFRADHHDVLSINYLETGPDGSQRFEFPMRQPEERLWDGRTLRYDFQREGQDSYGAAQLKIEVLDLIQQSLADHSLRPAPAEAAGIPRIRVEVVDASGRVVGEQMLDEAVSNPTPLVHAASGSRVVLHLVPDLDAARWLLEQPVEERFGFLYRQEAPAEQQYQDVHRVGETLQEELEDGTWTLQVLDVLPNLVLEQATGGAFQPAPQEQETALTDPRNPAIHLRITAPSGEIEDRWVLEADQGGHLPEQFDQLHYNFFWDRWGGPARQRIMLLMTPDGKVLSGIVGQPGSLQPLAQGDQIPFQDGSSLRLAEALANASLEPLYRPLEGVDFFDAAPAAAHLRITSGSGSEEKVEEVWLRTKAGRNSIRVEYTASDGAQRTLVLFFREQTDVGMPLEWQSKLTMKERDPDSGMLRKVSSGTIRVNDYLHFRGYRFFQTNHNPRDPTYSGIGVVYDPGITTVLLGFYMVMFGTIVVFLVKPIVTRKHRTL